MSGLQELLICAKHLLSNDTMPGTERNHQPEQLCDGLGDRPVTVGPALTLFERDAEDRRRLGLREAKAVDRGAILVGGHSLFMSLVVRPLFPFLMSAVNKDRHSTFCMVPASPTVASGWRRSLGATP